MTREPISNFKPTYKSKKVLERYAVEDNELESIEIEESDNKCTICEKMISINIWDSLHGRLPINDISSICVESSSCVKYIELEMQYQKLYSKIEMKHVK